MEFMLLGQCHVPSNIRNHQLIFQLEHWTRANASAVPEKMAYKICPMANNVKFNKFIENTINIYNAKSLSLDSYILIVFLLQTWSNFTSFLL
jgi:hypothetical protein